MITRKDLLAMPFYKKSAFTGSEQSMCYRVERVASEDEEHFKATVWPGPYCYAKTSDDKRITHQEDFSEEGLCSLVDWMNEIFQSDFQ